MQKFSSRLLSLAVGLACLINANTLMGDLVIESHRQGRSANEVVDSVDFIIGLESDSLTLSDDLIWSGWTYQQKICLKEAKAMLAVAFVAAVLGMVGTRWNRRPGANGQALSGRT